MQMQCLLPITEQLIFNNYNDNLKLRKWLHKIDKLMNFQFRVNALK